VPLSTPAQELIAALEGESTGYVFATVNGYAVSVDSVMRSICQKLNIERATPHDLRRTFGSTVTALGFGRSAMDRLLNHKSGGVGAVYDRYSYEAEDQRIMEAVASKIMMLVTGNAQSNVVIGNF
jgi:integrase